MAIDKRLQIFDEQGNPVDYDIMATDVKFQDEKDLPTKLGELEEEIGEGGYTPPVGGIPKSDLAADVRASLDKADTAVQLGDLAIVAMSGSYNDLQDKPNIPAGVTVDSTITQNGTNPVQGGAIYSALADKMQRVVINMEENNDTLTFTDADNNALTHAQVREILNNTSNYVLLNYDGLLYPPSLGSCGEDYWLFERLSMNTVETISIGWDDGIYVDERITETLIGDYLDNYVPTTRTVNGKALSSNITLNASDVGAMATSHPANAITSANITAWNNKADKSTTYTKTEVDGLVADAGKVKSVTVNGTKFTPDVNGDVDLGNLRGQDGNSGVASADDVESVNNLNGGTTDTQSKVYVLGANQGKRLRDQIELVYQRIQTLYGLLGNIAFWDGKTPIANILPDLDWGAPKHTVTLALSLTNAVVKYNGVVKNNGDTIPNVEEGSTIQLTVEAESGYELDSISSQAGTVNGSTVSLVMGTSNATLDITASASAAYTISYDLSNCAAPTGVTNPTTIKSGETKTIYLEAGNNFTMPASLPVGAVTGATASYTRDALDDTKATLVLSNATGNVTVDIDGVEVAPELHLVLQAFIDTGNSHYFIQGGSYNSNAKRRAMVVVKRSETSNPCTWGSTDGVSEDAALEAEYSAIPIPIGATQVTMKCNSSYYYVVGLLNSSGVPQNTDNTWTIGSTQKTWSLADYPNATHIQLIFKIGSGGTTQFSNQTLETIGIDFNIE